MRSDGAPGALPGWRERAAAVLEGGQAPVRLPSGLLLEIYQHARECYPEECCGLLLGPAGAEPRTIVRCSNTQSQRKARGESDLDATKAFWIDAHELLHALRGADDRGEEIRVIYHSHVDTEAYLSHTDLQGAIGPGGTPHFPDAAQLVVSVSEGGVRGAVCFVWNARLARFVGRPIEQV